MARSNLVASTGVRLLAPTALVIGFQGIVLGQVNLLPTVSPAAAEPGLTMVTVTGSSFPAGAISPNQITVRLSAAPPATGATVSVQAYSVTTVIATTRRVAFLLPASVVVSSPTAYLISISSAAPAFTSNQTRVTVNPAASILSVSPSSGAPGSSVTVQIQGSYSNFFQGSSTVNAGPGIAVSNVTVTSATLLQARFAIGATTAPGAYTVSVSTGGSVTPPIPPEVASLTSGFTVAAPLGITGQADPAPNAAGWNNTNVAVSFTCTGGALPVTCPTPVVVSTEGANQAISRTATDSAGGMATATVTLNIDKTAPVLTVSPPLAGATVSTAQVTITGTATDALSGLLGVTCNGAAATLNASGFSCLVTLMAGANTVNVTATDVAGNVGAMPLSLTYSQAPTVTLTAPTNLSYLNISPTTVNGTVSDSTATVTVNSISAPVANGQFSIQLPLAEGPNILTATAQNSGGIGTASIEVTLDTTPPHVTITSPPDKFVTTDTSISVSGIINDIVVGTVNDQQAQVTVNGSAAQVSNRTFLAMNVPLSFGDNVIQAVGRDRVGNAATTQITVTRQAPSAQSQIHLISGNNQTNTIGSVLSAPLVVALTDSAGNPAPNKPVIFKVTQNNGTIAAAGAPASSAIATTNAQGQAQAQWTLGLRAGAGGNTVEAYSVGAGGTAIFYATGNQGPVGKIVIDTGNDQIGAIGQPLPKPLIAVVVDAGNNRLANVPVTFTVKQGGGSLTGPSGTTFTLSQNADGQQNVTVTSDSDGRVAATLILGMQEGNANNLVEADFAGDVGFPASFTASGRAAGDPAKTIISGVVLDNSNVPIPGVTIRAVLTNVLTSNATSVNAAATVQSDVQGQFLISSAPVGFVKLLVDGSTATLPGTYPHLEYDLVTVAGQVNTVGQPIYLLPLNAANQLCATATTGGGTLTIPEAPGFSLTFAPGQVTFPGGTKTGCVSVTPVHGDRVPMAPGFGQQPRFIVTIQPAGAIFNPPAAITLPNVDGLKPREVTEMYSFDHDIGSFVAIGTGTVSDDGQVIRSNPGVGVLKAGWHCGGNPTISGAAATCGPCAFCNVSTCIPDPLKLGLTCLNPCIQGGVAGMCGANGNCNGTFKPAGTVCNSFGGTCDTDGQCRGGQCQSGCNSGNPCIDDGCLNGQCTTTPNQVCQTSCTNATTGSTCSVTNFSGTLSGTCENGTCQLCNTLGVGASCTSGGQTSGTCVTSSQGGLVCKGRGNQCPLTCNGGTCINGVCQDIATFVSMRTTTSSVNFTFEQDNGQFALRAGSHLLQIPGAAFEAQANVGPTVPSGTLQFVQLVNTDRRISFADNSVLMRSSGSFVLDTVDPYPTQASSTPAPNIVQIATNDSPTQGLGGLENEIVRIEIHESFQMYFTYKPQSGTRYTLGRAVWSWDPVLEKTNGNFTITSGSRVFGLDGVETTDPVVPNGTSCQLQWRVDNTHTTRTPSSADNALTQVPVPCP